MVEYYSVDYFLCEYVNIVHVCDLRFELELISHLGNTQAAVNYMLSVSSSLPD